MKKNLKMIVAVILIIWIVFTFYVRVGHHYSCLRSNRSVVILENGEMVKGMYIYSEGVASRAWGCGAFVHVSDLNLDSKEAAEAILAVKQKQSSSKPNGIFEYIRYSENDVQLIDGDINAYNSLRARIEKECSSKNVGIRIKDAIYSPWTPILLSIVFLLISFYIKRK